MKVLCLADIHGDIDAVKKAAEYARKSSIKHALILGDFPAHGAFRSIELSGRAVKDCFLALEGIKVFAIPGNCDQQDATKLFDEFGTSLHERAAELGGWRITGFGGSNVTPYDTPYEMDEEEIYSRLRKVMEENKAEKTVLALHCPPKDTNCDRSYAGTHVGSEGIRRVIEEYQPTMALCSHIHEAGGARDAIKGTLVANIGSLRAGRIGVLSLGEKAEINLATL